MTDTPITAHYMEDNHAIVLEVGNVDVYIPAEKASNLIEAIKTSAAKSRRDAKIAAGGLEYIEGEAEIEWADHTKREIKVTLAEAQIMDQAIPTDNAIDNFPGWERYCAGRMIEVEHSAGRSMLGVIPMGGEPQTDEGVLFFRVMLTPEWQGNDDLLGHLRIKYKTRAYASKNSAGDTVVEAYTGDGAITPFLRPTLGE